MFDKELLIVSSNRKHRRIGRCSGFNIRDHESGCRILPRRFDSASLAHRIIFHNCAVEVLIVDARLAEALGLELSKVGFTSDSKSQR